nr:putative ribonuclease H-like domain-containing protein [Tanacetum cinerariifolium]
MNAVNRSIEFSGWYPCPGLQFLLNWNYTYHELIWRRNGQDYDSTPKLLKNTRIVRGDGVTFIMTALWLTKADVRILATASGSNQLKEALEDSEGPRRRDYSCYLGGHDFHEDKEVLQEDRDNGRRPAYQDDSKALVTNDGEDIDWFGNIEEDAQNYAMMAYSSSNSGSNNEDDLHRALKDKGIVYSRCSRHMTGNKAYLADYQEFKDGSVAFEGSNGRITGKGKIKAGRVLVTKPQNKTPYELLTGKQPIISYLRPFECHVTILNTIDQLGKFDGNSDSGFLVGYFLNSKAFRVYNLETKRVEENLHVKFLENKPNVSRKGNAWMFDLDYLTNSINYKTISVENQANKSAGLKEANNSAGTQANDDQSVSLEEIDLYEKYFVLPIWSAYLTTVKSLGDKIDQNIAFKTCEKTNANTSGTNLLNTVSTPLSTASPSRAFNDGELSYHDDPSMPHLEDIYASPSEGIFTDSYYDDGGVKVWILVDLPFEKKEIRTRWVYRNKKDEKGVEFRNKARLVSQGHRQEEGIDYDKVFAPVARIEAIRIFLAFAFYMGFIVYQMDVTSVFMYGTINEEVYVSQPLGFVDPKFPNKDKKDIMLVQVYVDDITFGSTKKSWCNEFEELMKNSFQMSYMGELTSFLDYSVKTASTPIETQKPLVKDKEATYVDVHLYRSMIGSLMYLTASRPNIMFAVCACSRF